jgi:hypothetical protein
MPETLISLTDFLTRSRVLQADYARIAAVTGTTPRSLTQWASDTAVLLASVNTQWDPNYLVLGSIVTGAPPSGASGTNAQRLAYLTSTITTKLQWNVTDGNRPTYWFTAGDTSWRDSSGNDPDYVAPTIPPDTGVYG